MLLILYTVMDVENDVGRSGTKKKGNERRGTKLKVQERKAKLYNSTATVTRQKHTKHCNKNLLCLSLFLFQCD